MLNERCTKCGQTLRRLMLVAMLQDAGARCSPGALECSADGGEHEWAKVAAAGRSDWDAKAKE